jgi:virginiamycin B lyase
MRHFLLRFSAALAASICIAAVSVPPAMAQAKSELNGLASVSGTVTAAVPFKAAKVYFRNNERRMQYMVYTSGGKYQAMHLLPGRYEMRVQAEGLESGAIQLTLNAGANPSQNATLRPVDLAGTQIVSLDEMLPPGPGRAFMRDVCVGCHSPDFFGARHYPAATWDAFVEMMSSRGNIPRGFASPQERADLIQYLGTHFGPDSRKRAVKYDKPTPLDEAKLAKAMYVEYYFPPNSGTAASLKRRGQDPHFDQQGNVWITDRNVPNRLVRLDPRTGAMKEWLMPHPDGETHGLTIDRDGIVWIPERIGKRKDKDGLHLAAFDPKTEKFELFPLDAEGKIKESLQPHTPVIDASGNVWVSVIRGDRFYQWDRQTRSITLYSTLSRPASPYGIDIDSQGNVWMAEFRGDARVGKYDPKAGKFTDYRVLTQPGRIRRASVDLQDRVWFGIYDRGVIGWIDPQSGRVTEAQVPVNISRPYDPQGDYEGNVWFGDDGQGGATVRYNPQTREWTFYPTPQVADQPKIEITREGAIWYCPRSGAEPGVGVLYPDVSRITTLGAYYHDTDSITSRRALRSKVTAQR